MNAGAILQVQLAAKRGEIELCAALGASLKPEAFHSDVAGALKTAWLGARDAGEAIVRAIRRTERGSRPAGNVIALARRRRPGGGGAS